MEQVDMLGYGALGGLFISALTMFRYLQSEQIWPWHAPGGVTFKIWITIEILRTGLGAGVAWVLAISGPISVFGAVLAGAGAPAIIDKWGRAAPKEIALEPVYDIPHQGIGARPAHPGAAQDAPPSVASGGGNV
ncbi:hypothetical protein ABZ695_20390 [Streptomyces sp. NPDC006976]|uniref:hypothetical protein n=1 Tax=Streptomyces sp. NPDC006976 TaxID=3154311 RepID=UPI0033C56831